MTESLKLKTLYGVSFVFLALNILFIINEIYWFSLVPLVCILLLLSIFSVDKLLLFIVFCTPFAINLQHLNFGLGVSLPTEPLMFGLMVLFFIKLFTLGGFDKKILKHPITIAIIVNMVWIGLTSITSQLPLVSFKFFISRLWFIITFYFLATQLFKDYKNIKRFIWLYSIPLVGVIIYTTVRHASLGFTEKAAHWVMSPFFNDHTAYAAVIAMFIPIIFSFLYNKHYFFYIRLLSFVVLLIFFIAIVLSYTRAAWISLVVAFFVYLLFLFKIKFRTILFTAFTFLALFFIFRTQILQQLEKNNQDSSNDYASHVKSMTNISTDASNLERINRWKCAMRMFEQKPVFGWGPGTYSFKYAPFQRAEDKTIISTNAGDGGNAHSEYIGPLAESGIVGSLSFITIIITFIYKAVKLYDSSKNKEIRLVIMGVLLGLITYVVHGALNNFLDTDKASVPFWGFIAIITALEVYHKDKSETDSSLHSATEQSDIV